ncbi:DUF1561 family protein, partial [Leptospira kirschneri]
GNERYFVRWGGSDKNTTPLYYNPESGHLAQYDIVSGSLYCMYSNVGESNWNWVTWASCSDATISKNNPAVWNVSFETEEGGIITDYKGNILRVTRYGSNWGIVYAVKPDYLKRDITHFPTSLFIVNKDLLDWTRYTASNLGKTDPYCPAGYKESIGRVVRTLPPDFQLTDAWIRRLYDIARSTTRQTQHSGICGACLLQTFQMLAELQEYHSQGPLSAGGYFFDTAPNTDPFISFRQRYPHLDNTLRDAINIFGPSYNTTWYLTLAYALTMLPQYEWTLSNTFNTRSEILSYISSLINSPPGSIWLGILRWRLPDGTFIGHSVPILRISQGLVVIPTNVSSSRTLENFRQSLIPSADPNHIITNLERPNVTLTRFTTIELGGLYQNTFDFLISNNNCTGEGGDRRGTGNYPSSTSVNQCSGDARCALPLW